jgi:hypothetical protein
MEMKDETHDFSDKISLFSRSWLNKGTLVNESSVVLFMFLCGMNFYFTFGCWENGFGSPG